MASLADTTDECDFTTTAKRFITGDAIHSRRAHEARNSEGLLKQIGIDPIMTKSAAERLEWSAALGLTDRFRGAVPKSIENVFSAWKELGVI